MSYNKEKTLEDAKRLIKEKKLFFVEDIVALLPMSKTTFYDFFKVDSDELNTLKGLLEHNRVEIKSSMRSKWYKSENATLQVALMKIIATDEEAHRLSGTKQEIKTANTHKSLDVQIISTGIPLAGSEKEILD
tara:strand:+ start:160 stop:558 length:399 start_codon:yes stop_codon:yes gene_type:complete